QRRRARGHRVARQYARVEAQESDVKLVDRRPGDARKGEGRGGVEVDLVERRLCHDDVVVVNEDPHRGDSDRVATYVSGEGSRRNVLVVVGQRRIGGSRVKRGRAVGGRSVEGRPPASRGTG